MPASTAPSRILFAALLLVPALALGACRSAQDAPAPSPAAQSAPSSPVAQRQSSSDPQSAPPSGPDAAELDAASPINGSEWVASAQPVEAAPGEAPMVFHDLRIGEHEGFYRVVVEFTGEGVPGYFQSWADTPVEQGRGRALPVEGSSFLDLAITGTVMPSTEGLAADYYGGEHNLRLGPLDVREDGTFEDTTHIVIGMDRPRLFQIGVLKEPTRLVIDIQK